MNYQEIERLFETTGALQRGHFELTSGLHSRIYFQCALVLQYPEYLQKFCQEIVRYYQKIITALDVVVAPAIGGIVVGQEVARLFGVRSMYAEREGGKMNLRRGFQFHARENVLIVEDVITTGGSVQEVIELAEAGGAIVKGTAAIVDRSAGKHSLTHPLYAVYSTEVVTYQSQECPLCGDGFPLTKPGSRNLFKKL